MARLPRVCPPGTPQHIIQRGNNRQVCFADNADFAAYADWLYETSKKYQVAVHAWVFMTNHVHLLVTPQSEEGVSRMMQTLGRRYVRYFNHTYKWTGTLWEGRFKSCLVDTDRYLLTCQRYIEMNLVRAGMVAEPKDYHWSSYRANALGHAAKLCTPHESYLQLSHTDSERQAAYRRLFSVAIDNAQLEDIRCAVNRGLAFGGDRFKDEIEILTKRRIGRVGQDQSGSSCYSDPELPEKDLDTAISYLGDLPTNRSVGKATLGGTNIKTGLRSRAQLFSIKNWILVEGRSLLGDITDETIKELIEDEAYDLTPSP